VWVGCARSCAARCCWAHKHSLAVVHPRVSTPCCAHSDAHTVVNACKAPLHAYSTQNRGQDNSPQMHTLWQVQRCSTHPRRTLWPSGTPRGCHCAATHGTGQDRAGQGRAGERGGHQLRSRIRPLTSRSAPCGPTHTPQQNNTIHACMHSSMFAPCGPGVCLGA
jgi:hypothetical protein